MDSTLDAALEKLRADASLPALGAVSIVDGQIGAASVVGTRQAGGSEKALPTDAFHLGSDTKAMTATLVGMLIDQKKLSWGSTLGELIPELLKDTDPLWKLVTVDELLAHQAGLSRLEPAGKSLVYLHNFTGALPERRVRWLTERLKEAPDKSRGTFAYSNAGYTLLGLIAERVSRMSWESLIVQKLWKPLGINGAVIGVPPALWQHRTVGERLVPIDPAQHADNPPLMAPAGIVSMPLTDWARFARLHLGLDESHLLTNETLARLHTPQFGGNYSGGWIVANRGWAGGAALSHAGSNTMNFCVAWLAPKKRFAALIATNASGKAAEKACDTAVGLLLQNARLAG